MKKLLAALKKLLGQSSSETGFTLIELLVVIAIIGVLMIGSFVAINPAQKINQAKDANGKAAVDQVSSALQAYATQNSGLYPADLATLVSSGELKVLPSSSLTYAVKADNTNAAVDYALTQNDTKSAGCTTSGSPCTHWCWQASTGKAQALPAASACTAP